jgi:hypothetical protein
MIGWVGAYIRIPVFHGHDFHELTTPMRNCIQPSRLKSPPVIKKPTNRPPKKRIIASQPASQKPENVR